MAKKDYKKLASEIINEIGGKENISNCFHCITRLRFELKDMSKVDDEAVRNISGVVGTKNSGGMYQVIIGTDVPAAYAEVCSQTGLQSQKTIEEDMDLPKEKLTFRSLGKKLITYLAGCMVSVIPIMMAAGLTNAILAILGPQLLNVLSETSSIYIMMKMIYEGSFYFLPIFIGYSAAKQVKVEPIFGALLGAILITPSLMSMINDGTQFTIFGIDMFMTNYSQTVLPVAVCVLFMKVVIDFLKKVIPEVVASLFVPVLTFLIVTPVSLLFLAPMGAVVGSWIGDSILWFGQHTGFIGVGVVSGIFGFLIMMGMHTVIGISMLMIFFENGYASGICAAALNCTNWSIFGIALAFYLISKKAEKKELGMGCFISGIVGGVTEPTLFGVCMQNPLCFVAMFLGAFAGGCYIGITNVCVYVMGYSNFLTFLSYSGGDLKNLINGTLALAISFVVGGVSAYAFGFKKKSIEREDE